PAQVQDTFDIEIKQLNPLNTNDYAALKALYESTNGDNWLNNEGWSEWDFSNSTSPNAFIVNNWHGVTVKGNRIKDLSLYENQLTGEIPEELGNLSNLDLLNLEQNQLTGNIPEELSNLSNLRILWLSENQLTGEIPEQLGNLSNLQVLDLYDNQLIGKIPDSINNLSAYKRLGDPPYLKTDIPDQNTTTNSVFNLNISDNFGDINEDISNYSAEGLPDGLKLDSETGIISGTPTVAGDYAITITVLDSQSPRPGKIEEEFNIRIENDKPIGSPFTIIEDEGTATFAKDKNDGTYWIINGDKELQLQNRQGKTYSDNTTPSWNAIAVELAPNSENIYRVLLQGQNAKDGQAYVWTTNSDGIITKGSGWKSKNDLLSTEEEFNIDLNNDELIGSPFTIIEDEGTATFAKDKNDGTYWIINGDKELQLQNRQGKTYSDNTTPSW
ncbi:MAG: putative Ig domain-containing protein, partial [Trichodesmium sp. St19_bin1]|nr:putative Ig domain-containing protein [Trichodesmium sp. St19_bin1]